MKRKEPLHAIVATFAVCGLLMAAQHHGVAQAGQKYSVASRTVSPGTSKGLYLSIIAKTRQPKAIKF